MGSTVITLLASYAASVTPIDAATSSITGYLLGFGPLGIIALALAWLLFRGWRLVPPGYDAQVRAVARDDARGDLIEERGRALEEKKRAEDKADEALRIAQTQIAPLLLQFNATVAALIPLLQELVSRREGRDRGNGRP